MSVDHKIDSFRVCVVDGKKYGSVMDVVKSFGGTNRDWMKIKEENPDISELCIENTFAGQGSKPTPVADAETMMSIIFKLNGKKAIALIKDSARAYLQVLNPTEEFVSSLYNREEFSAALGNQSKMTSFFIESHKQVTLHVDTLLYIRVALPYETIVLNNEKTKTLTTRVINFGITSSLHDQDDDYNGRILF